MRGGFDPSPEQPSDPKRILLKSSRVYTVRTRPRVLFEPISGSNRLASQGAYCYLRGIV